MKLINKILIAAVLVILLALIGILLFWQKYAGGNYHAVYLKTGDLYFGKIVSFPHYGLKNVYLIQTNPQNQENPLSIQRFSNVFWGPEDYLRINREEVVWRVKLRKDSQLAELLKNNPSLTPAANQLPGQGLNQNTATTTNFLPQGNQP